MNKIKELDSVVLLKDFPSHHLKRGDVGTVVEILDKHTFEIEFIDEKGQTSALLPLSDTDIIRLNLKLNPV